MGLPGMGGGGTPPPGQNAAPAPDPNKPQTHAASGSGEELAALPSMEATLPDNPLKLSDEVKKHIGTDVERDFELGRGLKTSYGWYGPYYEETSGNYRFRTLFPLWVDREQPDDRASLYTPFYYRRRSKNHDVDLVFPLYWDVRNGESRTRVVGPLAWRRAPGETDNWLAPLVFQGSRKNGRYLHIPPLLTFTSHTLTSGFNLVGPAFCSWEGGSTCSLRTAENIDFGIAPLYFYGKSATTEYEVIPPLLHYYRYNDVGEKSLNIWGPMIWKRT
ncbi:MAG: hypothetical protein CSA75_05190, partial [Sorangium cellulosum]